MDYTLTNELQMLRKMYQEFVENEVKTAGRRVGCRRSGFPTETIPKLAK